ncbi:MULTISPECIES: PspA/IM30 family protein [unclassified Streptomyces]|uniref:PspA/IM30 family protein n=1 Tax=unclassified Streptomyces TaxID=2593676 RepID=UPI0004C5556D|nr:PspA/IM30 family protein [Streptomyces sp. NRRL S-118]
MTTKQTVLGRVAQLAKADVTALLEQAEDPRAMLDQLIGDYTVHIAEAERAVADTLDSLRLLEQDHREDVAAAREWGEKAREASRRADDLRGADRSGLADKFDTLAKVALGHQLQSEEDARAAEPTIAAQRELVAKLGEGSERMRQKLAELESARDRAAAARAAGDRRLDAVRSIDVLDPTSELSRFEDKVRREEARAMGKQELAASSLDAVFERLDLPDLATRRTEIEARLAALKAAA